MGKSILQVRNFVDVQLWREWCVLALAFFVPLSEPIATWLLLLGLGLWGVQMLIERRFCFYRTPFDIPIAALVIISGLSICNSPEKDVSIYSYQYLMVHYIGLYYLFVNSLQTRNQVRRLMYVLMASAVVVAGYGLYQYFSSAQMLSSEWVDNARFSGLKVRVFSTLGNPNILAGYLLMALSFAGGLLVTARNQRSRLICLGIIALCCACLALTYSRGAWVSVLAIIAIYGCLYDKRAFLVLLLVPAAAIGHHDVLMDRLLSIFDPNDTSAGLRMAIWESSWSMIKDHPFTGVGWAAYRLVYPAYDFYLNDPATIIYHAHNMYLSIAAEIGIPGFVVFCGVMYGHAYRAWQLLRQQAATGLQGVELGFLAFIAALTVSGFTDYILFNTALAMLFWLFSALVIICGVVQSSEKNIAYRHK